MIEGVRTISHSIHNITDSVRKHRNNTIVNHTVESTDGMELDDLDEDDLDDQTHVTRLTHETTTNADSRFGDRNLESLSNLTNEELLGLNSSDVNSDQKDESLYDNLRIDTVFAFEGINIDYVILICIRSNKKINIGLSIDMGRLNVALTREKKGFSSFTLQIKLN